MELNIFSISLLYFRWAFGDDAKCARKSVGWRVYVNGGFIPDATFKFTCENPPVPTAKATTTAKPPTKPDTTPKPPTKPPTKPETTTRTSVSLASFWVILVHLEFKSACSLDIPLKP